MIKFRLVQTSSFWPLFLGLVFLLLAFFAGHQTNDTIIEIGGRKTYVDPESSWIHSVSMEEVEVVDWAPHLEFTKKLVTTRTPFILKNSVVQDWKAAELWSQPNYLANHSSLKTLVDVKVSFEGTMTDHNAGRLLMPILKHRIKKKTHQVVNMTSADFFEKISDSNEKQYYYYYGRVDPELKKDVMPNSFMWVLPDDAAANELYLWLGGPGIGPALHYDMDHNFFVQVVGRKRFILIPPWQSKLVYPHPSLHPYDRKSQAQWETPDFLKFPQLKKIKPLVAHLGPGDVLYVPPYWWHKVHSVTASASLSALSTSGVFQAMKPLYKRNLTLDALPSAMQQYAVLHLIRQVLNGLFPEGLMPIYDLFESRWEPIKEDLKLKDVDCPTEVPFENAELFKADRDFAINAFLNVQTIFGSPIPRVRRDMRAIMEIEVLDWIEVTVASVLPIDHVYSFIKKCI